MLVTFTMSNLLKEIEETVDSSADRVALMALRDESARLLLKFYFDFLVKVEEFIPDHLIDEFNKSLPPELKVHLKWLLKKGWKKVAKKFLDESDNE